MDTKSTTTELVEKTPPIRKHAEYRSFNFRCAFAEKLMTLGSRRLGLSALLVLS